VQTFDQRLPCRYWRNIGNSDGGRARSAAAFSRLFRTAVFLCLLLAPAIFNSVYADNSVSVKPLGEISYKPEHRVSATVVAIDSADIAAEISAPIVKMNVQVGELVESGAVIAELECADFELRLAQEKAQHKSLQAQQKFAQFQLQKAQELFNKKMLAEELLQQRESELHVLDAQLELQQIAIMSAKRNAGKCIVKAPYPAVITEKLGQVGSLATPGAVLVKLVNIYRSEVTAQIPMDMVEQFGISDGVRLQVGKKTYPLLLRAIIPSISTKERTQEVRLSFTAEKPLPGSAGELIWKSTIPHLPAEYLVKRGDHYGVFIVSDQTAQFVELENAIAGRAVPVPLDASQLVVVKGQYRLQHGDSVTIK